MGGGPAARPAARTLGALPVRWKLAGENPFDGVKAGHQANSARKVFVPREVNEGTIAAAPDLEWKVIIALARYGGPGSPSEHFALKRGNIDWDRGTIRVTVPKLAHRPRLAHRTIPLFPELREHLLALFAEAAARTEYAKTAENKPNVTHEQSCAAAVKTGAWAQQDSNLRPTDYESVALTN